MKIWKIKPGIAPETSEKLSQYPKLLRQLLFGRGLVDVDKVKDFLEPKYENLHSPFLFGDMKKAVDRIWQAIENKEKICIYGDYDADAVTANAVLQQAFGFLDVAVQSYIPDRFTEGYGVNMEALEKIKADGVKLIITVDCGTNSVDAAEFCKQNNITLIITDHHEIIGPKPDAYALINPKNREDGYPYEDITGVGVAFKLATALLQNEKCKMHNAKYVAGSEKWLLDLVAIGTVADCHSLLGENRILVKYGLKVLAKTRWPGLRALIKTSALDFSAKVPDTYTLGFIIAPRLNAAGRLEHADTALHLLMEKNPPEAARRALELEEINRRRQDQTARIVSEAREQAVLISERRLIVLAGEGWNKGIVGLVAGRLAEEFHKPVIVLEKTDEFSTGSARTAGEFDILAALKYSSEHLVRFGGHKQAAGLTVETSKLQIFYQKALEYADANINVEDEQKTLELDAELQSEQLNLENLELIDLLEPFGMDNPKPKFLISQMKIASSRTVGNGSKHTQYQLQKGSKVISGIAFNSANLEKNFKLGDTVDVAAELIEDGWNGRKDVKLRIIDFRPVK